MNELKILYSDQNLAVLDKPAGILIHPVPNKKEVTLVDLITKKWPEIKKYSWPDPARPGIVHRLDKDTSGLILIAKNPESLNFLQNQFKNHQITKEYLALCFGRTPDKGTIETYTSHDHKKYVQQKISLLKLSWKKNQKKAVTFYETKSYYNYKNHVLSLLKLRIVTGRTHQIRNHLKFLGYPIIGDSDYNTKESKIISDSLNAKRQLLHSANIEFALLDNRKKKITSELPNDFSEILNKLEE